MIYPYAICIGEEDRIKLHDKSNYLYDKSSFIIILHEPTKRSSMYCKSTCENDIYIYVYTA